MGDIDEYRKRLGLPPLNPDVPVGLVPAETPEADFLSPATSPSDPWREKLGLPTSPMFKRTIPKVELPLPTMPVDPAALAEREMLDILSASEDPMEIINEVNRAEYLASSLKIPRDIAYGSHEALSQWWAGKLLPKPTLLQNIRSAMDNGLRIYNRGRLGYELMNLETTGGSPEAIAALGEQIDEIDKQMENLPYTPKQWLRYALTMAAQSVPMMVKGLTKGYAMGAATGATSSAMMGAMEGTTAAMGTATGGISIPAMAILMASVGQVVGMTEDLSLNSAGLQYLENRERGVPAGINGPLSVLSGFIQGALESAGNIAVLGVVKIPGLKTLGKMVSDKVFSTGMAGRVATALAARMASTGIGEGAEEVLQELATVLTEQVARDWSAASGVQTTIPPADMAAFLERFKQSFIGGASAGLIFGVAGMPGAVRGDVRQFSTIRDLARATPDKAAFIESVKKYGLAEGKAGEAAWEKYLGKVWDKQQKEVKQKLAAPAPAGTPSPAIIPPAAAAVQRAPTGALQTAVQNQVTSKGGVEADFVAGAEGQRYGYLHYETVGDLVTITEAVNETEVTDVRKELILSLAAANPGKTIEWQVANEEEADLLDEIVTTNPRGPEFGIQRYEGPVAVTPEGVPQPVAELTQERFVSQMSTLFNVKDETQADLLSGLVSKFAAHLGLEGDAFVQRFFSPELIRQNPQAAAMLQAGKGVAGTTFEVEGKQVSWEDAQKIAKDNTGMVKAAFSALQTADFHHAIHELIHPIIVLALTPEDIALLESATVQKQADWTENTHEWIAANWETYLGTGKAPTPELATFFEKLSKLLRDIVSYMRERGLALGAPLEEVLSPEFTAAYDNLLQDPRSGLRQAAAEDIAPNTPENAKTDNVERALQQELAVTVLEPAPEPVPEDALPDIIVDPMQTPVVNIALNRIVLSDEVPNFKRAANAKGIITELKSKEYIRVPANPVTLWQRIVPKGPGELEIITGRHRVDLARRLGETAIPAQILREADGFTAAMAMTFDAEANIRGGKGDIEDYAIYFQKSDISIEDAEARGLLDTDKGRKGFAIGRYATNGLFSSWANGLISTEKAAAIAAAARGDEQLTASALTQWSKDKSISAETLATFIDIQRSQRGVSRGEQEGVQGGFGWDSEANTKDSMAMAEQKAKIVRDLRVEQNVLKNATQLGKAEKAAILAPYGIGVGDTAALKGRITAIEEEINRWGFWMTDAGLQTQLREKAGLGADALYHRVLLEELPYHSVTALPPKKVDPFVNQPSGDDVEELYRMVEATRGELVSLGKQYTPEGGEFAVRPNLKDYGRVKQKAEEYAIQKGRGVSYNDVWDIDAATVIVETFDEVYEVGKALLEDSRVIRFKNNFSNPAALGFRGLLFNVRLSNGVISELQVVDRNTWTFKNSLGHLCYELWRDWDHAKQKGELEEDIAWQVLEPLEDLSSDMYEDIYLATFSEAIWKASSRVILGRLKTISATSKSIGVESMLSGSTRKHFEAFVSTAMGQAFQSTKINFSAMPSTSTLNVAETAENSKPWFAPLLHPGENFELVGEQFIRKPVRVEQAKQELFSFADKTDAWMKDDAAQIGLFEEAKVEEKISTVSPTLTVPKAGTLFHGYGETAEDLTKKAVEFFGITANSKEAGFILPDGRMLDLSGAVKGERHIDHRSVNKLMGQFAKHPESEDGLANFLSVTQSARIHDGPTYAFIHLTQMPTDDQMAVVGSITAGKMDALLSVTKPYSEATFIHSTVMEAPTPEKIRDYFEYAMEPRMALFHRDVELETEFNSLAEKQFGVTEEVPQKTWILSNGKMLNFSTETAWYHGAISKVTHEVAQIADMDGYDAAWAAGALRLDTTLKTMSVQSTFIPTSRQMDLLWEVVRKAKILRLELMNSKGETVVTEDFPAPSIAALEEFYSRAAEREASGALFHPATMRDGLPTPKTLEWFGSSVVTTDEGTPLTVFHGTLSEFDRFDVGKARGGYFGKAFYFTDSAVDASENYAQREGGDVQVSVNNEADRLNLSPEKDVLISQWIAEHPEDAPGVTVSLGNPLMVYEPVKKTRPTTTKKTTKKPTTRERVFIKDYIDLNWFKEAKPFEILKKIAAERLGLAHEGAIIPVYLKMKNPVYFDGPNTTVFDLSEKGGFEDILQEVLEGWTYEPERLEGNLAGQQLLDEMLDWYTDPDSGERVTGGSILAEVWKRMGYDGIIQNAGKSFPGMEGTKGATHYIVFRPEQAKSIWNRAPTDFHTQLLMHPEDSEDRRAYAKLVEEAANYDTLEQYVAEQEGMFGEGEPGNLESYRAIWEEAHREPPVPAAPKGIPTVVREEKEYDYAEKVELAKDVADPLLAAKITMGDVTQAELEGITAPVVDDALKAKMAEAQRQVDEIMDQFSPEEQYVITLADELSTILSFEAKAKKSQARITSLKGRLDTAIAKNAKLILLVEDLQQNAKLDKAYAKKLSDQRAEQIQLTEADKRVQLKARLYAQRRAAMAKFRQQSQDARQKQRAAAKLKALITKLVAKTMKPAGKGVEFLRYAEEIGRIQSTIDPKRHWASTPEEREKSRTFFGKHPELAALVPPATLQRLYSVPVQNLTLAQIEEIYELVKVLRDQGRLFRSLDLKQAQRGRTQLKGQLAAATLQGEAQQEVIGAPKKTPVLAKGWMWSLKPDRIAKWLDGIFHGVKEHGPWFKILQTIPNQTDDLTQKSIRERTEPVAERMKELKLSADPLAPGKTWLGRGMDIDGFRMSNGKMPTVDQVMYWYLGMKNQRTADAILYGVKIPKEVVLKGISQLSKAEIEIADMIGKDFGDNFPRIREAFIDAFNMDLAREENYVPMNRLETSYKSRKEAVGMELAGRQGLAKQFMDRGFTHERIDIAPEHQKPVNTHLMSVWQASVKAQEGFINQDRMIKDMHSIIESDEVKAAVQQKFGSEMNEWLAKYTNALAGEDEYRHQNGLEKFSRIMRSNAAIAWLGFNMLSAAKQLTGVVGYLADAGPLHMMSAAAQYLAGAGKSIGKGKLLNNTLIDEVYEKSERLRNRRPAQELDDLRRLDNTLYQSLLKKIGMAGMLGLQTIDTATVVIGWKAVYDKTLAKTGDEMVARAAADEATTRSQPSSRVQDMAMMYRSGEVLKWFTMFTSELSQTWNRLSFDVPAALRNGQYTRALADLISFSIVGMGIALASGALHGDDDEKKRKKLILGTFSQLIEAIPFIGSDLYATISGRPFVGGGVRFFPAMANIQKLVPQMQKAAETGEWETTILSLAEAIALVGGIPFVGPRRGYQAAKRGDLEALLGWPKEEE